VFNYTSLFKIVFYYKTFLTVPVVIALTKISPAVLSPIVIVLAPVPTETASKLILSPTNVLVTFVFVANSIPGIEIL
jgi:hypothetical protein